MCEVKADSEIHTATRTVQRGEVWEIPVELCQPRWRGQGYTSLRLQTTRKWGKICTTAVLRHWAISRAGLPRPGEGTQTNRAHDHHISLETVTQLGHDTPAELERQKSKSGQMEPSGICGQKTRQEELSRTREGGAEISLRF